jgi:hypothetical protein
MPSEVCHQGDVMDVLTALCVTGETKKNIMFNLTCD